MLMLVFYLGEERYAVDACQILEVIPCVSLRPLPQAPQFIAGLFNYRGTIVPVIDLCQLTRHRSCQERLSTRILLTAVRRNGLPPRIVGLRTEHATETIKVSDAEFTSPGIVVPEALYLGKIFNDAEGMVQCIRLEYLLPDSLVSLLFTDTEEHD